MLYLLLPFVLTTVGGFTPPAARFTMAVASSTLRSLLSLFVGGKVPVRGSIGVSVEEGLLRSVAADATGDSSLINLSGACPTLSLADRLMLFSPFSAACNWATFPPYLFGFSSCCLA